MTTTTDTTSNHTRAHSVSSSTRTRSMLDGRHDDSIRRRRRVLAAIDGLRIDWQDQMLTAAASIGIAHSTTPHVDFDGLLSHADAACFAAKEYGGNRLVAASREGDELAVRTARSVSWKARQAGS